MGYVFRTEGKSGCESSNQEANITNSKNTVQTKATNLNEVMENIKTSSWGKNGWNKFWRDNPEFTYRVDTVANFTDNNKKAKEAILAMASDGNATAVTYEGKDLTDGKTIIR